MKELIFFLIVFLLVYLIYLFFIILRKKKLEKYYNSTEVRYLVGRYKINIQKSNMKEVANGMALANAFVISTTVSIVSLLNNLVLKLLVGFVVLIPLILITYHLMGRYFLKKYGKKE